MSFIFSSSHPVYSFWMTPSLPLALVITYILRCLNSVVLTCLQTPGTFPTAFWTSPQEYLLKYSCLALSIRTTYSPESYTKLSSYSLYLTSVKSGHLYYYLLSDPKFEHPVNWTSKILFHISYLVPLSLLHWRPQRSHNDLTIAFKICEERDFCPFWSLSGASI